MKKSMKTITRLLLLFIFILGNGKLFSQIKFTIHATSSSATTITVTGSGSATTNGTAQSWNPGDGFNQIFGNSSFNYVNGNLNFRTFGLTGNLKLTNGVTPVNFNGIVLDDDTGSDRDGKLAWFSRNDNAWQNPQNFGRMLLSN